MDGFVEYIPQKTKMEHANTVRVPLNQKARDILERYKDLESALLPRFSHFGYNKKIKEILKYVGIDRTVIVLDPKTREDVAKPLYEVATTHTARKTFIGNLYRQVKDPNLIASMSGHSEGSRAFARYRKIDDEMKKELVRPFRLIVIFLFYYLIPQKSYEYGRAETDIRTVQGGHSPVEGRAQGGIPPLRGK